MLGFSEYQTGTIDLSLSFMDMRECTELLFCATIRDTYVHITLLQDKENFYYKGKLFDLKRRRFPLIKTR